MIVVFSTPVEKTPSQNWPPFYLSPFFLCTPMALCSHCQYLIENTFFKLQRSFLVHVSQLNHLAFSKQGPFLFVFLTLSISCINYSSLCSNRKTNKSRLQEEGLPFARGQGNEVLQGGGRRVAGSGFIQPGNRRRRIISGLAFSLFSFQSVQNVSWWYGVTHTQGWRFPSSVKDRKNHSHRYTQRCAP